MKKITNTSARSIQVRKSWKKESSKGFTIIELLLAMGIFSAILGACAALYVQISQQYFKGVNIIKSQEAARTIVNEITAKLQVSKFVDKSPPPGSPLVRAYCAGSTVYYARIGTVGLDTVVKAENPGLCNGTTAYSYGAGTNPQVLVDSSTSIHDFVVTATSISIITAYGPLDTLDNPGTLDIACKNGVDSKFCGVSWLNGTITRRTGGGL